MWFGRSIAGKGGDLVDPAVQETAIAPLHWRMDSGALDSGAA